MAKMIAQPIPVANDKYTGFSRLEIFAAIDPTRTTKHTSAATATDTTPKPLVDVAHVRLTR